MSHTLAGVSSKSRNPRARRRGGALRRAVAEALEPRRYLTEYVDFFPLGFTQTGGYQEGGWTNFDLDWSECWLGVPGVINLEWGNLWSMALHNGIDFEAEGNISHLSAEVIDNVPGNGPLKVWFEDGYDITYAWYVEPIVYNFAPTANFSNSGPINEGGTVTVSLTDISDPSPLDAAAGYTYSFDAGSGSIPSANPYMTFTFTDDGEKAIYATIYDKDGGQSYYGTTVTVANVAPYATYTIDQPNNSDTVTVGLAGANDPSSDDTAAGFKYSFSTNYNSLAGSYAAAGTSSSATFPASQLAGGAIVYARVFDNDGGYRNYSSGTTDMSAELVSSSQINLTWTDDVEDELGWRVQWSLDGATFSDYENLPAGTDFYEAMELDDGTRHWFRVRAYSGQGHLGESIYSPKMAHTTWLPTMNNVTATHVENGDIIEVEWDAPARAANQDYETFVVNVYRDGEEPSASSLLASAEIEALSTNYGAGSYSHQFIDLLHNKEFQFTVRALNADGKASAPPGPVKNTMQYGNMWHSVATRYSSNDLVEMGVVTEVWVNEPEIDYEGPYGTARVSGTTATVIFKNLPRHSRAQIYNIEVTTLELTEGVGTFTVTANDNPQSVMYVPPGPPMDHEYYTATTDAPLENPIDSFRHNSRSLVVRITLDDLPEDVTWTIGEVAVNIWGPPWWLGKNGNQPPVPEEEEGDFNPPDDPDEDGPTPIDDDGDDEDYNDVIYTPDEEDDEDDENQVNLVVGGWDGFWTAYAWPYGNPNFAEYYGSSLDGAMPEAVPANMSVLIGVNDDNDEGNTDAAGDPVADNVADAHLGHQVDWDVAPMFMTMYSTLDDEVDLGQFSLSFPTDKVMVWRPNDNTDPGEPAWVPVGNEEVFYVDSWADLYEDSNWQTLATRPAFLVEAIAGSAAAHDVAVIATFARGGLAPAEDTVRFTTFKGDIDVDSNNDDTISDADDPIEADPDLTGVIIPLNNDDDDENDIPDNQQASGEIEYEDDLVPLIIRQPTGINAGTLILKLNAGTDRVRVWANPERDSGGPLIGRGAAEQEATWDISEMTGDVTVWLEGVVGSTQKGDVQFVLQMQTSPSSRPTTVDTVVAQAAAATIEPTAGQEDKGGLVPSVNGATGLRHYVTPKAASSYIEFEAKNLPAGEAIGGERFRWRLNNVLVNGLPGNKVQISRAETARAKLEVWDTTENKAVSTIMLWIIWATGNATSNDAIIGHANVDDQHVPQQSGPGTMVQTFWTSTFQIQPATMFTDTDRPDFSGNRTVDVPGGTNVIYGVDNKFGATKKWDVSRRMRMKAYVPTVSTVWFDKPGGTVYNNFPNQNFVVIEDFPQNPLYGNDDVSPDGEDNEPDAQGIVTATDDPKIPVVRDAGGAVGDTMEFRFHAGEFVRVEIERRWFMVSDFVNWRHHGKLIKRSEVTDNQDYNLDNDKVDVLWVDNGSTWSPTNGDW